MSIAPYQGLEHYTTRNSIESKSKPLSNYLFALNWQYFYLYLIFNQYVLQSNNSKKISTVHKNELSRLRNLRNLLWIAHFWRTCVLTHSDPLCLLVATHDLADNTFLHPPFLFLIYWNIARLWKTFLPTTRHWQTTTQMNYYNLYKIFAEFTKRYLKRIKTTNKPINRNNRPGLRK